MRVAVDTDTPELRAQRWMDWSHACEKAKNTSLTWPQTWPDADARWWTAEYSKNTAWTKDILEAALGTYI